MKNDTRLWNSSRTPQEQVDAIRETRMLDFEAKELLLAVIAEGYCDAKTPRGAASAVHRAFGRVADQMNETLIAEGLPQYADAKATAVLWSASEAKARGWGNGSAPMVCAEDNSPYEWGIHLGGWVENYHGVIAEPTYSFMVGFYK